jgi:hypothetical protein
MSRKPIIVALSLGMVLIASGAGEVGGASMCATIDYSKTAWPAATERDAAGQPVSRFIPPELYTGAPWKGERELVLRPVELARKPLVPADHPTISFSGPLPWRDDSSLQVIRRFRTSGRSGPIEQFYAVNERGDGLGRVADQRQTRSRPRMAECFKFPLGVWRQGETRTCRESTIRIIEIDFTYECVPHALKFRWNDEGTYTFAPDRGMFALTH